MVLVSKVPALGICGLPSFTLFLISVVLVCSRSICISLVHMVVWYGLQKSNISCDILEIIFHVAKKCTSEIMYYVHSISACLKVAEERRRVYSVVLP